MFLEGVLAEREGFEPPVRLPVLRISSAARSTTLPPLRGREGEHEPAFGVGAPISMASRGAQGASPAGRAAPPLRFGPPALAEGDRRHLGRFRRSSV